MRNYTILNIRSHLPEYLDQTEITRSSKNSAPRGTVPMIISGSADAHGSAHVDGVISKTDGRTNLLISIARTLV
jgi:hypothetical protein